MDITFVLEKFILVAIIFGISLVIAMYSTYAERKVAAFLQDRLGPDRAGPAGMFQPLADGLKMFTVRLRSLFAIPVALTRKKLRIG